MKNIFSEYYPITTKTEDALWKNGFFCVDANIILNLHEISPNSAKDLIKVLKALGSRLWIPYWTGLEYQRRKLGVIHEQIIAFKDIDKRFKALIIDLEKNYSKHQIIKIETMKKKIQVARKYIQNCKRRLNSKSQEEIIDLIASLFEGKVGKKIEEGVFDKYIEEGKKRYKDNIPPGYKDFNQDRGIEQFGDVINWFQMMDEIKSRKAPLIYVTDDTKDDWWDYSPEGDVLGPHHKLRREMKDGTGYEFQIYPSQKFYELAKKILKIKIKNESIEEIKELKKPYKELTEELVSKNNKKELLVDSGRSTTIPVENQSGKSIIEKGTK